jgi:hypothetical protein
VVVPISGEETALIESLEGKKKRKTQPPPFPAVSILRANPTVVNVGNPLQQCHGQTPSADYAVTGIADLQEPKYFCIRKY